MSARPGEIEVVVERLRAASVIRVSGELDLATAPEVARALRSLDHGSDCVVLDVADLTFIDSTGLNLVIHEHRSALADGREFVMAGADGEVLRALRLVGLDLVMALAPDVDSVACAEETER